MSQIADITLLIIFFCYNLRYIAVVCCYNYVIWVRFIYIIHQNIIINQYYAYG